MTKSTSRKAAVSQAKKPNKSTKAAVQKIPADIVTIDRRHSSDRRSVENDAIEATKKSFAQEALKQSNKKKFGSSASTSVAPKPVTTSNPKLEVREKVNRRRQIDPTTCEREYTLDEVEFMQALDLYKRQSGRMFPTCSEVLEVMRNLGYVKIQAGMTIVPLAHCGAQPSACTAGGTNYDTLVNSYGNNGVPLNSLYVSNGYEGASAVVEEYVGG